MCNHNSSHCSQVAHASNLYNKRQSSPQKCMRCNKNYCIAHKEIIFPHAICNRWAVGWETNVKLTNCHYLNVTKANCFEVGLNRENIFPDSPSNNLANAALVMFTANTCSAPQLMYRFSIHFVFTFLLHARKFVYRKIIVSNVCCLSVIAHYINNDSTLRSTNV